MTQEQFLQDMIDSGYVKVKAKELRELLQDYKEIENIMNKQALDIEHLNELIEYWKTKYNNLKWSIDNDLIKVDLKV